MKTALLGAMLLLGLVTAASADSLYAVYPENCVFGSGGEGNIDIGNGQFAFGESHFSRISERVAVGNGFYKATYIQMSEGEPVGQVVMSLRITDAQVDVMSGGDTVTARRCNR